MARIRLFLPAMHETDLEKLAEDLQRSWPSMPPEGAVNFFFRPNVPPSEPQSEPPPKSKRGKAAEAAGREEEH
jgi:hypothetical protein